MRSLPKIQQSPSAPDFLADPYAFYDRARRLGDFVYWEEYGFPMATSYEAVNAILTHPATGREPPQAIRSSRSAHLATYYQIEDHSLLRLEGPEHTRLKSVAQAAFTNEAVVMLAPALSQICDDLISSFPKDTPFDLLATFADKVPMIALMRLLGFPDEMAETFQGWARDVDGLFHSKRDRAIEDVAEGASIEFHAFMASHLANLRSTGGSDDAIGRIVSSERTLADEEIMALVMLVSQASTSATGYALGTAIWTLSKFQDQKLALAPVQIQATVEECLRLEPPFHIIMRYAQDDVTLLESTFPRETQIGCLIGSACRDDAVWPDGNTFDPFRAARPNLGFGKGVHACLGGSMAHMIMKIALPALFSRCPSLRVVSEPTFADDYMFRRLERLDVQI